MTASVLIVEDEAGLRETLLRAARSVGLEATAVEGVARARAALEQGIPSCVLLDIRLRDGDGLEFLGELQAGHPSLPVIMATAYGDSERTIAAMKGGAFDYLTKPFDLELLTTTLLRAARAPAPAQLRPVGTATGLIRTSPAMLEVWKAIGRAAQTDVSALITGETGVGKEQVARAIHAHSRRREARFLAVNLSAVPWTLLESELFGHEKGAFTGAAAQHEGFFESVGEGTLLLDELGDLDPGLQTKLLRVLQDGVFRRVGGKLDLRSRARVLAATSRPVRPEQPGSSLRADLFYRLGVVIIDVPPLRRRRGDIPLLVQSFLESVPGPQRAVSEAALQRLQQYPWPGNVRELRHAIERAAVLSRSEVLDADDLELGSSTAIPSGGPPDDLTLRPALAHLEREYIQRALQRTGGNRAEAARLLGIARPQLYARMKELGIS
jgi:DNA-binding NtrC family response regulator